MRLRHLVTAGTGGVLLAGGITAGVLLGGTSASAAPAPTTTGTCPSSTVQSQVAAYLQAHPDVATEWKKLQGESTHERRKHTIIYLHDHKDVRKALAGFAEQARQSYASSHPDVQAYLAAVKAAPKGQKASTAKSYLAAHPDVKAELKTMHEDVRACVTS